MSEFIFGELRPDGLVRGVDPKPIFKGTDKSELGIGDDGDDLGSRGGGPVEDLYAEGYRFLIRKGVEPRKTKWRNTCEVCGVLLAPVSDPLPAKFRCEFNTPNGECECNRCLLGIEWQAGQYRPLGGQPPKRCKSAACKREAARLRKRLQRARENGQVLDDPVPLSRRMSVAEPVFTLGEISVYGIGVVGMDPAGWNRLQPRSKPALFREKVRTRRVHPQWPLELHNRLDDVRFVAKMPVESG